MKEGVSLRSDSTEISVDVYTGIDASGCVFAGYRSCCFSDNCEVFPGCNCDHACHPRGDCCSDISTICPGKSAQKISPHQPKDPHDPYPDSSSIRCTYNKSVGGLL